MKANFIKKQLIFLSPTTRFSRAFTVIELLVAITVIGILLSVVAFNFSGFRIDRNLSIAQNELETNLRKAQSYTLSARVVSGIQSGQFFILKIDSQNPTQYQLQAIYNITATPTPPTLVDVESYQLPLGVQFASTSPVTVYRNVLPNVQTGACALVGFKSPYARAYFNGYVSDISSNTGCTFNNFMGDDYLTILNYVANVDNYRTSTDSYAVIQLTDSTGTKVKKVLIRGVTGVICSTQDGVTCSN